MIVELIQELERYQKVRTKFSDYLPSSLDKLRAKAIAQKALREGCSVSLVTRKILEDSEFQKVTHKFGRQISCKLASETVKIALQEELSQHQLGWLFQLGYAKLLEEKE
ncbi:MAG: hypothetical protein AB4038_22810 [Prochloraceae cyanobacterium]